MNGSGVIAKMAGTESMANTTSAISTSTRHRNSGVANHAILPVLPLGSFTQNFSPCISLVTFILRFIRRSTGFLAMSGFWSIITIIFTPVAIRMTAKKYITQENCITSAAPRPIMMARSTMTPRMPQNSTRCW